MRYFVWAGIALAVIATIVGLIMFSKIVGPLLTVVIAVGCAILITLVILYNNGTLGWALGPATQTRRGWTTLVILGAYILVFIGFAFFEASSRMYMAAQNSRNDAADQAAKHDATNITLVDVMPEAAYNSIAKDVDDELKKGDDMDPSIITSFRRSMVQALDGFLPALADSAPEYALKRISSMLAHQDSLGVHRDGNIIHTLLVYKARAATVYAAQLQAKASGKSAITSASASNGVGLTMQTRVGNTPSFRFDLWTGKGTAPQQPAVRDTAGSNIPRTVVRDTTCTRGKTLVLPPGTIKPAPPSTSLLVPADTLATQDPWERMIGATSVPFTQSPR